MIVREIIKQSMRNIGVLDPGLEPTPSQANEALDAFNSFIKGMMGNEIGPRLEAVSMTASTTAVYGGMYQIVLGAIATLTFPASPKDGWRVGFADMGLTFDTYTLTVNPNGRPISTGIGTYSAANQTYTTEGTAKTFFFRSDVGWTEEAVLALTDTPYFPVDMHAGLADAFTIFLHSQYFGASEQPSPALAVAADRGRQLISARYGARTLTQRARTPASV